MCSYPVPSSKASRVSLYHTCTITIDETLQGSACLAVQTCAVRLRLMVRCLFSCSMNKECCLIGFAQDSCRQLGHEDLQSVSKSNIYLACARICGDTGQPRSLAYRHITYYNSKQRAVTMCTGASVSTHCHYASRHGNCSHAVGRYSTPAPACRRQRTASAAQCHKY